MQKRDVNILIVEDDASLGKVMAEAITRAGFHAMHVTKPEEALGLVKLHSIHAAVVDCMLPKMNGRELAKKLKDEISKDLPVILISGIFKDKAFIRETLNATGAAAFLTKPFEMEEFMAEIEKCLIGTVDAPLSPLQKFFLVNDISAKTRIKAVNEIERVHGFDLPWIYSLLMHPRVKGHLNIVSSDGEVCGVGFCDSRIVQVNQGDNRSFFGSLLIDQGFITQKEIDEGLKNDANKKGKRFGERLVDLNLLSPHAIDIVSQGQQGLRLSQTVGDSSVKINFVETDDLTENAMTDAGVFTQLLNDWLNSKYTLNWLQSEYMMWMSYDLKKGANYSPTHRALNLPVVQRVPKILDILLAAPKLETALQECKNDDHFYRALHALIVCQVIRFGEQNAVEDYDAQRTRLQKLVAALKTQNHFERLGLSAKAKESEIKPAYHELAKALHPDKLSPSTPEDVRTLARSAFEMISVAQQTLTDPKLKESYMIEIEQGRADAIFQAERLSEQAAAELSRGDQRNAWLHLQEAIKLAPPTAETRILLMWAKLRKPGIENDSVTLQAIREDLATIPPEDRHNAKFYFIKGLLARATKDNETARRNFDHAISVSPDFIDARREINALNLEADKPVDILNGNLKDVVGLLFKKKK